MRTYRVIGAATYLDRAGNVRRVNISLTTEAPDAETAKTLILGKVDIRAGACADYDPQARWDAHWDVVTEDVTAEQEAMAACGLVIGASVLHKSAGSAKKGADARVGTVKRIYIARKNGEILVRCSVDWPAPNRINGDGWHRSDVLASALVVATNEEIERRRALNRAIAEENRARSRLLAAVLDAELAAMGLRLAHGQESHLPDAQNVRLSNGCNVWALPLVAEQGRA